MRDATNLPLEGLRSLVDLAGEGACLVDPRDWRVVYANPQLLRRLASPGDPPAASSIFELAPDLETPAIRAQLAELAVGKRDEAHIDCRAPSNRTGSPLGEIRVRRVETDNGVWLAMILTTSAAATTDETTRREGIDPLTGLADRGFILDKLSKIIHGDRLEDQRSAVLFIDVDGFKQVNDSYGHLVGDRVLCEVARRLAACVRAADHVGRFGGDEFLILLERVGGRSELEPVVRRIQAAFLRPISFAQGEVTLGVSVGAAQAGVDGGSAEELIDA
ncbi:MAG: GGDEF domain-containing protein, partial [Pirellulales bacterium]